MCNNLKLEGYYHDVYFEEFRLAVNRYLKNPE